MGLERILGGGHGYEFGIWGQIKGKHKMICSNKGTIVGTYDNNTKPNNTNTKKFLIKQIKNSTLINYLNKFSRSL